MNSTKHNLYEKLIMRLEMDLQRLSATDIGSHSSLSDGNVSLDSGWQLFDNTIINQVIDPFWLSTNQL